MLIKVKIEGGGEAWINPEHIVAIEGVDVYGVNGLTWRVIDGEQSKLNPMQLAEGALLRISDIIYATKFNDSYTVVYRDGMTHAYTYPPECIKEMLDVEEDERIGDAEGSSPTAEAAPRDLG